MAVFEGKAYEKASSDALAFIKRQLDVNNFKYQLTFAEEYADTYEGDIMWGYVTGLSSDEDQVFAKYISPATYYDFSYKGKVTGNARNLTDYSDYAVNVYVIHDAAYKVITCPIKADGTWESVMTYRETYTVKDKDEEGNETGSTHTETVTYPLDISVGEGIKEFRLAKGLKGHWEQISSTTEMTAERYVYEADTEISAEDGGYGYLEGYSTYKIACELSEMGVKTPAGKDKWHPSSVMSILQNEKYKGDALLQKTFTKDFLTHKLVVNNGEVPQYYVEGHHEGIVTADQFDQVQAEILRRKGMQKYSGVGLFSSIIRCGECGSWYGAKVWHSNDKYRKVIYRCNNKYADGCKCKTPHINEDELKKLFIKAANELFSEREEILANTKVMMEMVCETDSLDRDLQDSITELNVISEQMQIAIAENSRVALDQDEYEKRYAELTLRYEKAKAGYDDIAEQIESKKAKRELFKGFIRTLEKQDGLTYEFDAGIWSSLVQEVIVKSKDDIRFIFKNGFEVRV